MNNKTTGPDVAAADAAPRDPLIDEVRAIRKDLSDRFGNDVEKLAEYVRAIGEEHRRDHPRPAPPHPPPAG